MDAIENAAYIVIGRACGFAGFAVLMLMAGLSFDPVFAARVGGVLSFGVAGILALYALRAPTRPYKRTELWMMLTKDARPPAETAQRVIGEVLRVTYSRFARQAAALGAILAAVSLLFQIVL